MEWKSSSKLWCRIFITGKIQCSPPFMMVLHCADHHMAALRDLQFLFYFLFVFYARTQTERRVDQADTLSGLNSWYCGRKFPYEATLISHDTFGVKWSKNPQNFTFGGSFKPNRKCWKTFERQKVDEKFQEDVSMKSSSLKSIMLFFRFVAPPSDQNCFPSNYATQKQ